MLRKLYALTSLGLWAIEFLFHLENFLNPTLKTGVVGSELLSAQLLTSIDMTIDHSY